ncbi:MAG: flagellar basal body-associated FliL family protein [Deltaproteobacteria bacterium]|jgi:flagellar FliL protein|nr:flagellar basal body-associated FliL family protein [Deltaproteobacteria bacterium]
MAEKKPKDAKDVKETKKAAPPPGADESGDSGSEKKGGKLKFIIIILAAMLVGGGGSFAAMKFFLKPAAVESPAAVGDEFSQTAVTSPGEEGDPIVAPSKRGGEQPAADSGGHSSAPAGEGGAPAAAQTGPITVKLETFTTNLNEPSSRKLLVVTLSMEVDDQEAADELNQQMPAIQDSILMLLSGQSEEDIRSIDGKERLKSQILNRTNAIMSKHKVKKVNYSKFVFQ